MTDNQHNNLEQFFRQNLENYSPEPPDGFWARMEPSIPVRPPFWSGWATGAGKWLGMGLLAGAVILAGVLWWNDRQRVEELSQLVQAQQREIEQIKAGQNQEDGPSIPGADEAAGTVVTGDTEAAGSLSWASGKVGAEEPVLTQNKKQADKNVFEKNSASQTLHTDNQLFTKNNRTVEPPAQTVGAATPLPAAETLEGTTPTSEEVQTEEKMLARTPLQAPESLGFLPAQHLGFSKQAPSVKKDEFKIFEPYPRFSFEVGASAFVMPVRRLFENDTVISETGAMLPSLQTGLLVNFEMNSVWMFQTGFHFKNVRSENLSVRYNSFPLTVRRRWAWGRHSRLEMKTGFALNSLMNARILPEKTVLRGLKPSYFSWQGGAGFALPFSESLSFVTEANLGLPITPVANGKRPVEVGIYAGLRFLIW